MGVVGEWCVEGGWGWGCGLCMYLGVHMCMNINKHATHVNSYLSLHCFSIFKGNFVKTAAILNFKIIDTNTYLQLRVISSDMGHKNTNLAV